MPRRRLWVFFLCLFVLAPLLAQDTFTGVQRIVAIGDVHGGFDEVVAIMRGTGVINNKNKWISGKTHLVQTGDVVDRGPDPRKVMDLLMDLEKQAQKAGGRVHALFGNHDVMNIYGDLRDVAPEEYAAFKRSDSADIRQAFFENFVEDLKKRSAAPPVIDDAFRKKWEEEHPLGWVEHRVAFGPNGEYGRWLAKHNVVIKINEILFLHGGISPKYATTTRQVFNDTIRLELKDFSKLEGGMAMDPLGPLWYRGLAKDPEADLAQHVDQVLQLHGVRHIVIGHTPSIGVVLPRFGGKVILIDVGISKHYGANPACLVVEGPNYKVWHRGRLLELPVDGQDISPYLKSAGADPSKLGATEDR